MNSTNNEQQKQTVDELFKKYSSLYSFEEGPPERLIDKDDFHKAVTELTTFHTETTLTGELPTAEEFLLEIDQFSPDDIKNKHSIDYTVKQKMIEFAKLHVKAALEAASEQGKIDYSSFFFKEGEKCIFLADSYLDKKSILKAYPLGNIK